MDLRDVKVNGFCDRAIAASRPDYSGDRTWKEEELAKRQPIDATNIWMGGLQERKFFWPQRPPRLSVLCVVYCLLDPVRDELASE
jgi:hypothetical protein